MCKMFRPFFKKENRDATGAQIYNRNIMQTKDRNEPVHFEKGQNRPRSHVALNPKVFSFFFIHECSLQTNTLLYTDVLLL